MKSVFLSLALAASVAQAAPAHVEKDELLVALHNLSHRAEVANRTYLGNMREITNWGMTSGLALQIVDTFRAPGSFKAIKEAPRLGAMILLTFLAAHYAVAAGQYVAVPQRMHDPQIVQTAADVAFFFAKPIAEQYQIAQAHPEVREWVMQMSQSYEFIDKSLPEHKVTTRQMHPGAG